MGTIFMNSKKSGISDLHRLLPKLSDKTNLKVSDKYVALPNLSIYYTWKKIKNSYKNKNLKYQPRHRRKSLNYLMDHILYQIFKIILNISSKNGKETNNSTIRIYVNKIESHLKKRRHHLELLMLETMKLIGSIKNKITKDENGENIPHIEVTEVVLVHWNIVNNDY